VNNPINSLGVSIKVNTLEKFDQVKINYKGVENDSNIKLKRGSMYGMLESSMPYILLLFNSDIFMMVYLLLDKP
jgi:hypothetical protein